MPRKTAHGKSRVLRGRVTDELKRRAENYCASKGMSEGTLVRVAIIEYLDRQSAPVAQVQFNETGSSPGAASPSSSTSPEPATKQSVSYGGAKARRPRPRKPKKVGPAGLSQTEQQ